MKLTNPLSWFLTKITITQHDLAEREVQDTSLQVQRLEDLAEHHRSLAAIYQGGADTIRGHRHPLTALSHQPNRKTA